LKSSVEKSASSSLQLYKQFLAAKTARDVVFTFYKLRLALGLPPTAMGSADERYQSLKALVMPLCHDYFLGKRIYTQLEEKGVTVQKGTEGLAVCVVGAGPVGLRTAIELAMLGQEVTIVERQLPSHVDRRANVLKLWKWAYEDLHGTVGVLPSFCFDP
jgi:hypothetical protein